MAAGRASDRPDAADARLNRDVAIKVLPELFANDAERLARFAREAQTLASLNHPNIAHLHGLEEAEGVRALVMELVEGEDLSTVIERGPMPVADVDRARDEPVDKRAGRVGVRRRPLRDADRRAGLSG